MIQGDINAKCITGFWSDPAVNPCAEADSDRTRCGVLRSPEKWQ
jgi:hypothetical protein